MKKITIILAIVASSGALNETLYTAFVYMAQHRVGYDYFDECEPDTLLNYLQQAFEVDDETHNEALLEANNMKTPAMHLNVEVIQATGLIWKDPNGKSDPYCALFFESRSSKCYRTAVKNATLTPVWEESFQLKVENPEDDVLCLEVWDFDPYEPVLEKISKVGDVYGIQGFWKLTKDIVKAGISGNPDKQFMGSCKINVKDILVTGETDKWYTLVKPGKLEDRGDVHLRLKFISEHNTEADVQAYRYLLSTLLSHELKMKKTPDLVWKNMWSTAGETLLFQCQARNGLHARNALLSQWDIYSNISEDYSVDLAVFNQLARKLLQPMTEQLFSSAERMVFWEAARRILYSCFSSIKKLPMLTYSDEIVTALHETSGIISSISQFKVPKDFDLFPTEMYDWVPKWNVNRNRKINVLQMLEYAVLEREAGWWRNLLQNNTVEIGTGKDAVNYCITVIQLVMDQLQTALNVYDEITIKKIYFSYAETLYKFYDERLSDLCMTMVKSVCSTLKPIDLDDNTTDLTLDNMLLQLYRVLQRFVMHDPRIPDLKNPKMYNYQEWFRDCVEHWLNAEMYEAHTRIENAVMIDNLESSSDSRNPFTSSAFDMLMIFNEAKTFWAHLYWPDMEESITFIEITANNLCKLSIAYANQMLEKVKNVTGDDEKCGKFEVSTTWCSAVSNINFVQKSLILWANNPDPQQDGDALSQNKIQVVHLGPRIEHVISNTMDILENKTVEMFEVVGNKIATTTTRYLMEDTELFDTPSNSNASDRTLNYVNDNIFILEGHLNKDNFDAIVIIIWEKILNTFYRQLISTNFENERPPSFYSNLNDTLNELGNGFSYLGATESVANDEMFRMIKFLLNFSTTRTSYV